MGETTELRSPPGAEPSSGGPGRDSRAGGGERAPDLLEPGTRLDDRYEVVRLLGRGGMAAVYEVRHIGLQSTHALKVLDSALLRDGDLLNRFLAEGRIQAQLRHPNVVAVTEIVTQPVAGLVMEYIEGPDLAAYLRDLPAPPSPTEVLELFGPVLDAVGTAHDKGIVHRDLKPENIIVSRDARGRVVPKVTDFGIAKVLDGAQLQTGKRQTRATVQMGTFLYMSPEQIRRSREVDARSDVFALGAILYELVTRRPAFEAPSEFDTMKRIVEGTFDPPERVVGQLHPVVAGCIRKALAVDPAERFQNCFEFHQALEQVRNPDAVLPARPSRSFAVTRAPAERPHLQPSEPLPQVAPRPYLYEEAPARTPGPVPAPLPAPRPARPAPRPAAPPPPAARRPEPPPQVSADLLLPVENHSPVLAFLLGLFCIPGAGQFYNGQHAKGFTVLVIGLLFLCGTSGTGAGIVNILLAIDAALIASKRRRQAVRKWEWF